MTIQYQRTETTVHEHGGATVITVTTTRTVVHRTLAQYSRQQVARAAQLNMNESWFYLNGLHQADGTVHPEARQRFDDMCQRHAEKRE